MAGRGGKIYASRLGGFLGDAPRNRNRQLSSLYGAVRSLQSFTRAVSDAFPATGHRVLAEPGSVAWRRTCVDTASLASMGSMRTNAVESHCARHDRAAKFAGTGEGRLGGERLAYILTTLQRGSSPCTETPTHPQNRVYSRLPDFGTAFSGRSWRFGFFGMAARCCRGCSGAQRRPPMCQLKATFPPP